MIPKNNKRGILPLIFGLPTAVLITFIISVAVLLLIAFFFLASNKFIVIGAGLIILTFVFGFRGRFTRAKGIFMGSIIVIGLIFILASGTLQSIGSGDRTFLPEYSSTWCAVCNIGEQSNVENVDVDSGFFGRDIFQKITIPTEDYIPNGFFIQITPKSSDGEISAYKCNENVQTSLVTHELDAELDGIFGGNEIQGCTKYPLSDFRVRAVPRTVNIVLAQGQVLHIGTEVDYTLVTSYEPFCLFTLARGQLSSFADCSRDNLIRNVKDIPDGVPNLIRGQQFAIENVVIGYSELIDAVDVVNGKYLRSNLGQFQSCPIKTGIDGRNYADLVNCRSDSSLVCIPSTPPIGFICEEGTRLIKIQEDAECSGSGVIGSRIVGEQNCELICSDGKLSTRNCQDIIGLDKGEKEECVSDSECPSGFICKDNECLKIGSSACNFFQEEFTSTSKDYGFLYWRALPLTPPPITIETAGCRTAGWVIWTLVGGIIVILGSIALITSRPKKAVRMARRGKK